MRVTVQGLQPNANFALMVRSKNADGVSEWSRRFLFQTMSDTVAPQTPTGLTWAVAGNGFRAEWDAVTSNLANQTVPITRYEIELTAGSTSKVVSVSQTTGAKASYELNYFNNQAIFGTAASTVSIRVRAVDNKDLKSAWTSSVSATQTTPGPPTNLVSTVGARSITIRWTPPANSEIVGYNVYQGASANPSTRVASTNSTAYTVVVDTTPQYFSVRSVNAYGTESSSLSGGPFTATDPFIVDTTPPAVPTALNPTVTNNGNGIGARATVTWSNGSETDRQGIELQWKRNSDSQWTAQASGKDTTSAVVNLPYAYTAYDFRIRSYDTSGNYSAWSSTVARAAVPNTAPSNVSGLTATSTQNSITYSWNSVSDADLLGYEVTHSTSPTFASGNVSYLAGNSNTLTVSGLNAGTTYYARVRSIDIGSLTSAWSNTFSIQTKSYNAGTTDGVAPSSSPSATVTGGIGYLFASWNAIANNDPVTYSVHLGQTNNFTPSASTLVGETSATSMNILNNPNGTSLAYGTTYFVRIVARDADGAAQPSAGVSGSIRKAVIGDVDITPGQIGAPTTGEVDAIQSTINTRITNEVSTLDGKVSTAQTAANNAQSTANTAQTNASTALTNASNAQTAADNAQTSANNANSAALEAAGIANGKGKVHYGTSASAGNENDLWIDTTANANTPKRWNGSAWVAVTDKTAIDAAQAAADANTAASNAQTTANNAASAAAAAATAAGNAQTSADGKNTVWRQDAQPPTTGNKNGDIWFKTNDGNRIYVWTGAWTSNQLGQNAIANLAIVNAHIVDGTIQNAKIGNLDAAKINTGLLAAARIGANSISAQKLAIADTTNFVPDPYMDNVAVTMPRALGSNGAQVPVTDPSVPTTDLPSSIKNVLRLSITPDAFLTDNGSGIPTAPGDKFYVEAYVCHTGTNTNNLAMRMWFSSTNATVNSGDDGGWTHSTAFTVPHASAQDKWIKVSGVITTPAVNNSGPAGGARKPPTYAFVGAGPGNQTGWFVTGWNVKKMSGGELIVDGAITSEKVSTVGLDAAVIKFGTMSGQRIEANTLVIGQVSGLQSNLDSKETPAGAQSKANAASVAAIESQSLNPNSTFNAWSATNPDTTTTFGTQAPVKDTTVVRTGAQAARWNIDNATQGGINFSSFGGLLPNEEYFMVEVDVYLGAGNFQGSGFLIDWIGMSNNRAQVSFGTLIPNPTVGRWYRISKVVRRPTNATGTWSNMGGYLMANWTGFGGGMAAKNFVVDRFAVRSATAEEIAAFNAGTDLATQVTALQAYANTAANNARTNAVGDIRTLWGHPSNTTLIDGGDIYTNSINASKIALGDFNNYAGDGNFMYADSWLFQTGRMERVASTTEPNYVELTKINNSNIDLNSQNWFEITPGESYYVSAEIFKPTDNPSSATAASETFRVGINSQNPAGTNSWNAPVMASATIDSSANGVWTTFTGVCWLPANSGHTRGRVWVSIGGATTSNNKYRVRNVRVMRRSGGELIVDGSIQANKITAGTYTGGAFVIGAGGILRTANSNVQITDSGITVTGPNSSITTSALTTGTFGSGQVLTVNGDMLLNGNMTVQNSGVIKSSNFSTTAGYQLGQTGLIIRSGEVAASTLRAGTLTSDTGTIQIGAGASLVLNGGAVRSNSYTGTSQASNPSGVGFWLANDGLRIDSGQINANALTTSTITGTNLTLGTGGKITIGSGGSLVGPNFVVDETGLTLSGGSISGAVNISGEAIKTGSIVSNQLINGQPTWSLPLNGAATFRQAQILGDTVIGSGASDTTTTIRSSSWTGESSSSGWGLRGDGNSWFNNARMNNMTANGGQINGQFDVTGALNINGGGAGITGLHINTAGNYINNGGQLIALGQAPNVNGVYTALTGGKLVTGTWQSNGAMVHPRIETSPDNIKLFRSNGSEGGLIQMNATDDTLTVASERVYLRARDGNATVRAEGFTNRVFVDAPNGTVQTYSGLNTSIQSNTHTVINPGSYFEVTPSTYTTIRSGQGSSGATGNGDITLNAASVNAPSSGVTWGSIYLLPGSNSSSHIYLGQSSSNGEVRSGRIYSDTVSTGSANLIMTSTVGRIQRLTSSRRYKTDIRTYTSGRSALDIRPVLFKSKSQVADWEEGREGSLPPRDSLGVIAEEVEALGFEELVVYDDEGRVDAVTYDRILMAALPELREMRDARWEHEEKIAELEYKIEQLFELVQKDA